MNDNFEYNLRVLTAKKRIRDLYNQTAGNCYLSFSGGKDSTVVLALIKMCEQECLIPKNAIPAVFCDTKIEMDATIDFVNWVKDNWYGNVKIIETPKSFGAVIREYGKPMMSKLKSKTISRWRKQRANGKSDDSTQYYNNLLGIGKNIYCKQKIANKDLHVMSDDFDIRVSDECCHQMKKIPFELYNKENCIEGFLTGERMAEGGIRQLNFKKKLASGQNICTSIKGPYTIKAPLVDWSDDIINRFIDENNVPLSIAYTKYGRKRTGCFLCPFSQELANDLEGLYQYEPNKYKASLGFLKDVYIAQNVKLPFDKDYEKERVKTWDEKYERMRYEMLKKHRPNCRLVKQYEKERKE